MKSNIRFGILGALACLVMPFASRLPGGVEWVAQYVPDAGAFSGGSFFFAACASIPSAVVVIAFVVSKGPFYWPGVLAAVACLVLLGWWHHDNDLSADPQAAISMVVIPLYASAIGFAAGIVGVLLQVLLGRSHV